MNDTNGTNGTYGMNGTNGTNGTNSSSNGTAYEPGTAYEAYGESAILMIPKPDSEDFADIAGFFYMDSNPWNGQAKYEDNEYNMIIIYYNDCWVIADS